MTPAEEEPAPLLDIALERKRKARDRALRRRLESQLIPGLPVDADALQVRIPEATVGGCLNDILTEWTTVKEPFFDTVVEKWKELCPDFPGRPGRYQDGHLFLYVSTSGQVFSLRTRLPKIKKLLLTLPGAPKANRFKLHLEVHGTRGI